MIANAAAAGIGAAGSGSGGALGATAGLLSNPITAIIGAGLGIVQLVFSLKAHHAAAVKNEAQALNYAVPAAADATQQLFTALDSGKISASDATVALDSLTGQYENLVYNQFGVKRKSGNGPDLVENTDLKAWVAGAKSLISAGGGTFTTKPLGANSNGFAGLPSFKLNYQPPVISNPATPTASASVSTGNVTSGTGLTSIAGTGLTSTAITSPKGFGGVVSVAQSLPSWVWYLVIGLIVLKVVFK